MYVSSIIDYWQHCVHYLERELPKQQFQMWIKPLVVSKETHANSLILVAPNRFVKDWVIDKYLTTIKQFYQQRDFNDLNIRILLVDDVSIVTETSTVKSKLNQKTIQTLETVSSSVVEDDNFHHGIIDVKPPQHLKTPRLDNAGASPNVIDLIKQNNPQLDDYNQGEVEDEKDDEIENKTSANIVSHNTFESFVEGKSNQLARAAAMQVAENPGGSYNPLFLYGGVGLGKTHLMHAVGNALRQKKPNAKVVYLHSERFVADMVKALQLNAINDFKRYYRSVDALLIDDIQFFANKERSQEEFFHTFNALLEGGQQIILTCDRYPREIKGLEERLKSRFGWGLTVAVEPPELETRVAILMQKAQQSNMDLPRDSAFFIAQRIRSNVRELEGALRRVMAQAHFQGVKIDIDLIKDSLKDLLSLQDRLVSIDNIQKTVAEYYKIKLADLLSKRRNRSVARPRQVAMALAKELTSHSLPEIGDAFGGRDHTTVLHACRKVNELKVSSSDIREDVNNLMRILTT